MGDKLLFLDNRGFFFLGISLLATVFCGICAPRTLAFIPSVIAVIFFLIGAIKYQNILKPEKEEIVFFITIIILAFISSFWAPNQDFSIERSIKITSILLPGTLLLTLGREFKWPRLPLAQIAIGLYLFTAFLLLFEKTSDHFLLETVLGKDVLSHKLNRSYVVFSFFSVPVLFLVKSMTLDKVKKLALTALVLLSSITALYYAESQTAQLCFLVGAGFLYLYPANNKIIFKTLSGLILISIFVMPFLIKPLKTAIPEEILLDGILKQASIIHRLEVWEHAASKAINSPLYGNGIEALRFMKSDEYMVHQKADSVLHAHNAALQIWLEFGVIGILLALIFVFYVLRNIQKQTDPAIRQFYMASFMTCLSCALTGYGFWQGWLLGLFFFMAVMTMVAGKYHENN